MGTQDNVADQINVLDKICFDVPPDCRVRFYNDDYTTKDFVVDILISVFHKSEEDAIALMETVHHSGSAVVGVYTYDIAVTRSEMAMKAARKEGFPLRITVEM